MIAATPYSYSYTQPATTILYHGTLAVEPIDRGQHTKIVYTLFYDQAPLGTTDPRPRRRNRASRTKRFERRGAGRHEADGGSAVIFKRTSQKNKKELS